MKKLALLVALTVALPAVATTAAGRFLQVAPAPTGGGGGGPVSVSDSFDRANGGLGANWATITGHATPTIFGNGMSGTNAAARYVATFAADQYAEADVGALMGVIVRASASAQTYYIAKVGEVAGEVTLRRVVAGVSTVLDSVAFGYPRVRLAVVGNLLTVYGGEIFPALDEEVLSLSDSAIASGSPGVFVNSTGAGAADNFNAGDQ